MHFPIICLPSDGCNKAEEGYLKRVRQTDGSREREQESSSSKQSRPPFLRLREECQALTHYKSSPQSTAETSWRFPAPFLSLRPSCWSGYILHQQVPRVQACSKPSLVMILNLPTSVYTLHLENPLRILSDIFRKKKSASLNRGS